MLRWRGVCEGRRPAGPPAGRVLRLRGGAARRAGPREDPAARRRCGARPRRGGRRGGGSGVRTARRPRFFLKKHAVLLQLGENGRGTPPPGRAAPPLRTRATLSPSRKSRSRRFPASRGGRRGAARAAAPGTRAPPRPVGDALGTGPTYSSSKRSKTQTKNPPKTPNTRNAGRGRDSAPPASQARPARPGPAASEPKQTTSLGRPGAGPKGAGSPLPDPAAPAAAGPGPGAPSTRPRAAPGAPRPRPRRPAGPTTPTPRAALPGEAGGRAAGRGGQGPGLASSAQPPPPTPPEEGGAPGPAAEGAAPRELRRRQPWACAEASARTPESASPGRPAPAPPPAAPPPGPSHARSRETGAGGWISREQEQPPRPLTGVWTLAGRVVGRRRLQPERGAVPRPRGRRVGSSRCRGSFAGAAWGVNSGGCGRKGAAANLTSPGAALPTRGPGVATRVL